MSNHQNVAFDSIHGHTKALLGAMYALGRAGLSPREVQITERHARIVIEPPPAASFIAGALRSRQTFNGVTRTVFVASFHGCQLEWEETHDAAATAQGAAR